MLDFKVLDTLEKFVDEFRRCCHQYQRLSIAVAWCGNPVHTLPYEFLEDFNRNLSVTLGTSFYHTHPDAFEWFNKIGADVKVFKDDLGMFHPKVYLFREKNKFALFIGSSNLTYSGFYSNYEVNCFIEGNITSSNNNDILLLEKTLKNWHSKLFSFKPNKKWIVEYQKKYQLTKRKQRKYSIHAPHIKEDEEITTTSWLQKADWEVYIKKVSASLQQNANREQDCNGVLDASAKELPYPWTISNFNDIDKRRIIGGIEPYACLGHVAASGQFRRLLVNGKRKDYEPIVEAINVIMQFNSPIPWEIFKKYLDRLISLGPTMKVWGRVLCIVRPDLFCTVASNSFRTNLSKTIGVPKNRFDKPEGYIQLIKLIHSSPWFNSNLPKNKHQASIWKRRVAFLDGIFY